MTGPGRAAAVSDWVLVIGLAALSGVIGVFGVFFLPTYVGSLPLPVVVLVVGVGMAVIPRVSYRLTRSLLAAFLPVLVWFVVTAWLFLTHNGLYLAVPVVWQGWQFALLLGVGALSAAASVGLLWGDHLRAQFEGREPGTSSRAQGDPGPGPRAPEAAVQERSADGG